VVVQAARVSAQQQPLVQQVERILSQRVTSSRFTQVVSAVQHLQVVAVMVLTAINQSRVSTSSTVVQAVDPQVQLQEQQAVVKGAPVAGGLEVEAVEGASPAA
jgi:hypothetical protein